MLSIIIFISITDWDLIYFISIKSYIFYKYNRLGSVNLFNSTSTSMIPRADASLLRKARDFLIHVSVQRIRSHGVIEVES